MCHSLALLLHFHWNHFVSQTPAHPHLPDASVNKSICPISLFGRMPMPFQFSKKCCHHHIRSDLTSAPSLTKWSLPLTDDITWISLRTNLLPTTFVACCRMPTNDFSSLLLAAFLPNHSETIWHTLTNFCTGSQSSIAWVSASMPRNVRQVVGPSVLSCAIGMPNWLQHPKSLCIFC